jgi:hypothetical protein
MNEPSIQNLDFIRQLIAELRADEPYDDLERLRMIYGQGIGTDMQEE